MIKTRFFMRGAFALLLGVTALAPDTTRAETVTIGQTFLANGLDPAEGSNGWALVSHGIAEQLFRVARNGELTAELAEGASQSDDGSWKITLKADRSFSDGTPVTADAVAAALNRTGEANPSARASAGRITFAATGDLTLVAKTEKPTSVLPSVLAEWAFPVYKVDGDKLIFTGPYAVSSFTQTGAIDLVANEHYEGASERPDIHLKRVGDAQSLALGFAAGDFDMAFNLPVETLPMVEAAGGKVITFPVSYQYMMWMNTRTDVLSDVRVRKAIDLAINRDDLATAAQAGIPATGAFAAIYPFAAETAPVFDPQRAKALLEEAGWGLGADGIRERNGRKLELVIWAYPQRPDLVTFQPVVRAALAEIGIAATTQVTESPTAAAGEGNFDLFLWAQHTASAGDPAQFLSLFLESGAANNYSGWSNADYDDVIAKLREARDPEVRNAFALEAQEIIARDAPVSFLLTPEWHVAVSPKLADYEAWGSDYYVIRPDLKVSK